MRLRFLNYSKLGRYLASDRGNSDIFALLKNQTEPTLGINRASMNVYKFRDCLLNTLERSVIRDNNHLELTTKTFDVLQFLIENAGKVVTKDEILGKVWNGSFVEESNLTFTVSLLRKALGDRRDS